MNLLVAVQVLGLQFHKWECKEHMLTAARFSSAIHTVLVQYGRTLVFHFFFLSMLNFSLVHHFCLNYVNEGSRAMFIKWKEH